MEEIYTFKPKYTKKEINDLLEWFRKRTAQLPETLRLSKSTYTKDLKRTVNAYVSLLSQDEIKPSWNGYIAHLMLIRERLKEQGFTN